jgi:SAM-dependent methyltransferase
MATAEVQGELWGRDPRAWADFQEPQLRPLYDATLDALEPLAGKALLDAGCGTGLVVRLAADRGAAASGLDASAPLLQVACARTPGAELCTGDIQDLPYGDATFDVVTAFNAIQYAADPAAAVQQLARVCRPGGQVAVGVWGHPGRCQTEALFARLRSLAPPAPGTPAPLAVSDPGVVESLLEHAGLSPAGGGEVPVSLSYADHQQAWVAHASAGALQKVIDIAGPDSVRQVVHDVLEADRKPDGQLRQDNIFRYVLATKPMTAQLRKPASPIPTQTVGPPAQGDRTSAPPQRGRHTHT